MIKLTNLKDSRFSAIDSDVDDALVLHKGLMLAGGAVRDTMFGTDISDYDLFLTDKADLTAISEYFVGQGFGLVFACPLGHLFTYMKGEDFKKPEECVKVQIICKRRYNDIADLINSFDFSATYFGMLWNDDEDRFEVYTDHRAIKDVRKKQLSLVNLEYPSSTLNRLYKYRNKGYYTGHIIKEIVGRIAEMGGSYDPENDTLYVD
jgi:hypothetical protein